MLSYNRKLMIDFVVVAIGLAVVFYYNLYTSRDGEIFGMLSVNQYIGAVWYHNWYGTYIRSLEHH